MKEGRTSNGGEKKHNPEEDLRNLFLKEVGAESGTKAAGPAEISEEDFNVEMTAGGEPRISRLYKPLVGIALSGGGIRSAIFNLGVLQGLARTGILKKVNYLATVSGGGFVGGFWSSWRHAIRKRLDESKKTLRGESNPEHREELVNEINILYKKLDPVFPVEDPAAEDESIRNLRAFSNFLIPHPGLLNKDGLRVILSGVKLVFASLALFPIAAIAAVCVALLWSLFGEKQFITTRVRLNPVLWMFLPSILFLAGLGISLFLSWFKTAFFHSPATVKPTIFRRHVLILPAIVLGFLASAFVVGDRWVNPMKNGQEAGSAGPANGDFPYFSLLLAGILGLGIGLVLRRRSGDKGPKRKKGGGSGLGLPFLAVIGAFCFLVIAVPIVEYLRHYFEGHSVGEIQSVLLIMGGSLFCIVLSLIFFDPAILSMHELYRSRICRAFLGSAIRGVNHDSNLDPDEVRSKDDITLSELEEQSAKPGEPVHLICCAANDLAGDPLENLNYGATSAVLSKHGLWAAGSWRKWTDRENMQLSSALTASAAAFNTQMGSVSVRMGRLSAFVMGALNLRLGLWVRHPHRPPTKKALFKRFSHTIQMPWRYGRLFPGFLFFCELLNRTKVKNCYHIHLSDGGHFEIFGLYELVRRHCRYIIVSEAGVDPAEASKELGNSIRKIRTDLGVEIDLDVSRTGPGSGETVDRHVAVGTIKYPGGIEGIIIYLRTGITGDEPVDVLQYRNAHPEFPYEKTGDQFFDAAQWEAYRRLGEHIGYSTFDFEKNWAQKNWLEKGRTGKSRAENLTVDQVFINTRNRWKMLPGFMEERLIQVNRRSEAFAREMLEEAPARLVRQIYPEATDIVRSLAHRDAPDLPDEETWEGLSDELKWVRLAAVFLEGVWRELDFETYGDYPDLKPWFNLFRRWTGVEAFRKSWWVMRTVLAPEFADFLERSSPGDLRRWEPICERYSCEEGRCGEPGDDTGQERFCYRLWIEYTGEDEGGKELKFQVGRVSNIEEFVEEGGCRVVRWNSGDFEIFRRFWGVGIGTQFARALIRTLVSSLLDRDDPENALDPREEIEMRVELDEASLETISLSDQIQFYHGLGFEKDGIGGRTMVLDVRKWYFDAFQEQRVRLPRGHGYEQIHKERFSFGMREIKTGKTGPGKEAVPASPYFVVEYGKAAVVIEDPKNRRHPDPHVRWKSSDFQVHEKFWNLGIGTMCASNLIDHLVAHVSREMAETFKGKTEMVEIWVEIDRENTWSIDECIAFYKGLDFEEVEESGELVRKCPLCT